MQVPGAVVCARCRGRCGRYYIGSVADFGRCRGDYPAFGLLYSRSAVAQLFAQQFHQLLQCQVAGYFLNV